MGKICDGGDTEYLNTMLKYVYTCLYYHYALYPGVNKSKVFGSSSQSVGSPPAVASVAPGNLLEMHILRPYPQTFCNRNFGMGLAIGAF